MVSFRTCAESPSRSSSCHYLDVIDIAGKGAVINYGFESIYRLRMAL